MSDLDSSTRYRLVESLYQQVLDLPREQRTEFLDSRCEGDAGIREEVELLLEHYDAAGNSFLGQPVHELSRLAEPPLPRRIGRYEIVRLVGEGGMGSVYEAFQENPRRSVAVKLIRSGLPSRDSLRRFEHEADILGRLQHPGIAHIYEAGIADVSNGGGSATRLPFFATEYIQGESLLAYARSRRLNTAQRLELVACICDAVHHAHQKGVIHRDLKPANVLVGASGQPKVLDFGVARVTDSDVQATSVYTDAAQIVGTLPYMSPEQIGGSLGSSLGNSPGSSPLGRSPLRGESEAIPTGVSDSPQPGESGPPTGGQKLHLDTRTDVYALGVILYELLAGRTPNDVRGKSIVQAARIITEVRPEPLDTVNKAFRGDLSTIVGKALEKDPERRYASVSDLAADIRRFLRREPIAARPPSAVYQLRMFARRNKTLVGAAVAIVIVLIGATAWTSAALIETRQANERAVAINDFLDDILASANPATGRADVQLVEVLREAADEAATRFADHPELEAEVRYTLGRAFQHLSLHDEALVQVGRAHALYRDLLGPSDELTRRVGGRHVWLLFRMRRLSAAVEAGDEVLAHAPTEQLNDATSLYVRCTLAQVRRLRGEYDEAEARTRQCLNEARESLGEYHPTTVHVAEELAHMLWARVGRRQSADREADLNESAALYRDAWRGNTELYGEESSDALYAMVQLAITLRLLGDLEEAADLARRVFDLAPNRFGTNHELCSKATTVLAQALADQGRFVEAAPYLVQTVETMRARFEGQDTAETLSKMSDGLPLLDAAGEYATAERYAAILYERFSAMGGHSAGMPLRYRAYLARFLSRQGRLDDADAHFEQIMPLEASIADPMDRVRLDLCYAGHLTSRRRFEEAEARLLAAVDVLPEGDWVRAAVCQELARLYEAWGRPEEAAAWRAMLHDP
ncbi:MAG: hypothetical protein C4547_15340 [Phycisphaerales bacterium]|nr:MAG: hypothetical protein C4547_15340 [Phycisphaerales bacterium]